MPMKKGDASHPDHSSAEPSAKRDDWPVKDDEIRRAKDEDEIQRMKDEATQAKDQYLRTLAEFENTKKRLAREKDEFVRYASESMVRELLPIIDGLDQALVAVDKQSDPQAVIKGVHLIYRQLLGLLEKEGVKRILTIGEPFDPHKHEAVGSVDADDGVADDTVLEEVQVGYLMHGRVIRPAMVKVATHQHTAHRTQHTADSTPRPADDDRRGGPRTEERDAHHPDNATTERTEREEEA